MLHTNLLVSQIKNECDNLDVRNINTDLLVRPSNPINKQHLTLDLVELYQSQQIKLVNIRLKCEIKGSRVYLQVANQKKPLIKGENRLNVNLYQPTRLSLIFYQPHENQVVLLKSLIITSTESKQLLISHALIYDLSELIGQSKFENGTHVPALYFPQAVKKRKIDYYVSDQLIETIRQRLRANN